MYQYFSLTLDSNFCYKIGVFFWVNHYRYRKNSKISADNDFVFCEGLGG